MKTTHDTFAAFMAAVKANLSGWYVLLALLLLSVLFSGCEKEEIIICPVPEVECTTEVTAVKIMCGYGAFGDIWFKTQDDNYLQPWVNHADINNIVVGQKYTIGFWLTVRDNKYKDMYTCMAALPEANAVTVTCISTTTAL